MPSDAGEQLVRAGAHEEAEKGIVCNARILFIIWRGGGDE